VSEKNDERISLGSVTLRDLFAMAAVGGILATDIKASDEQVAYFGYVMADLMLEARKNEKA
jgi:hypothetical protein